MHILTSPIHYMRKRRARRRQVQTVLHMLSVSGVIRPSHIEPRYFEPSSQVNALYRREAKPAVLCTTPAPQTPVPLPDAGLDWTKLRQLVFMVRPSHLQIEQ